MNNDMENIMNFKGIFNDAVENARKNYTMDMIEWVKFLIKDKCLTAQWCIMNNKICVNGDVDLGDNEIKYPFGVVAGEFKCREDQKDSPMYPDHVGIHPVKTDDENGSIMTD